MRDVSKRSTSNESQYATAAAGAVVVVIEAPMFHYVSFQISLL